MPLAFSQKVSIINIMKKYLILLLLSLSILLGACGSAETAQEDVWEDQNPSVYQGEDNEWIDIDIEIDGHKRKSRMKRGDYKANKHQNPSYLNTVRTSKPTVTKGSVYSRNTPSSSSRTTSSSSSTSKPSSSSRTTSSSSSRSSSTTSRTR